ncbi:transglutaminase-like cysteine peptidase, partial [Candidatus Kaiserbacteria bacterium]|nr:transglutaminase-like cysteine peptidase [Candidatus Kaiserbacteria bacterium]
IDVYGRDEWWALPSDVGDCEDYALLKRQLLHQAGIPLSSLLIGVVRQKNGDGHAVLVVRTTRGNLVLDNLTDKIRPWDEVPYRWLKVQAPEHSGKWRTVNLVDLDPATASLSE